MLGILLRKLKRCRAVLVLAFDGNRVSVVKGAFTASACRELSDYLVRHSQAGPGEIHLLATNRLEFVGDLPPSCHQGIRNVVMMHLH